MNQTNNNETFKMTYSAKQQEEILAIRKKYAAPEKDKLEQLRALDNSASKKASCAALTLGIMGTLLFGLGMSIIMSDFGKLFGQFATPAGIISGIAGIIMLCCAYPLYVNVLKRERKRIAPEIMRLSDELIK